MRNLVTQDELAYIAGIVDGEGYLGIIKNKDRYNQGMSMRYGELVSIKMKSPIIVKYIQSRFPGSLYQGKTNKIWTWTISKCKCNKFIKQIYPFLRLKNIEAEILFKLRDNIDLVHKRDGKRGRLKPEILEYRDSLYQKIIDMHSGTWKRKPHTLREFKR